MGGFHCRLEILEESHHQSGIDEARRGVVGVFLLGDRAVHAGQRAAVRQFHDQVASREARWLHPSMVVPLLKSLRPVSGCFRLD